MILKCYHFISQENKDGADERHSKVKLIIRDTDYAVRAICHIAKGDGKITSTAELVKALKMPRPFLRKILQTLNRNGILRSRKGQGGGFALALPAGKIYLIDLMEIFQGPLKINECVFKKRICAKRDVCILKAKIDSIEDYVVSKLKAITIESLL